LLGSTSEVARCGHLLGQSSLEAVGLLPLRQFKPTVGGVAVARLVIIRRFRGPWTVELDAARQIRNPAGYIGVDFIDDSSESPGFFVQFLDERDDGTAGFVLALTYLSPSGETEGAPTQIAWNASVARFQEFDLTRQPFGFKTEMPAPPHRSVRSRASTGGIAAR
jgi:hypothetical protein